MPITNPKPACSGSSNDNTSTVASQLPCGSNDTTPATVATLFNKPPPDFSPTKKKGDDIDEDDNIRKRRNEEGWYIPQLDFNVEDLASEGCRRFFSGPEVGSILCHAVVGVVKRLYGVPEKQPTHQKSITLYLRPMPGVAYTAGKYNKQIHFSTTYLEDIAESRVLDEIIGVIRHEMVHAWQYDGNGTAPGGLVEGIADWVRLRNGFIPPHWSRGGHAWDDGYQNTAYFLDWLEETCGDGTVSWINAQMKDREYSEDMWCELSGGKSVEELWGEYKLKYRIKTKSKREIVKPAAIDTLKITLKGMATTEDTTDLETVRVYNAAHPERTTVVVDQETEPTGVDSIADSHDSSSPYDPFAFQGETAVAEIFAERLKNLTFDGSKDGKRFIKEFEALIQRVNPEMSEENKRLLLVTSFVGSTANNWYEEVDLDDELPYATLSELLQGHFKGKSMRKMKLIDRDAKLS